MIKIKDLPQHKRPREKLMEFGPQGLKDEELLAILLRTGYKNLSALKLAKKVLSKKSLKELGNVTLIDLMKIKGIGLSGAASIVAAFEIANRIGNEKLLVTVKSPTDVLRVVDSLRIKKREYMIALYLNARSELIKKQVVSIGTLTESLVHPREVFVPAIKNHAVSVVLAHNHPSGNSEPSDEDIAVTQNLKEAGKILGIEVVDHIIVSKESYVSLKEKGIL